MPDYIFFYGTLMSGAADSITGVVMGHQLYDLLAFPAAAPGDPHHSIMGELVTLPSEPGDRARLLSELDSYEGVPHLYTREIVEVQTINPDLPTTQAYIYLYSNPEDLLDYRIIPTGSWNNRYGQVTHAVKPTEAEEEVS